MQAVVGHIGALASTPLFATWITRQLVFNGLVRGMVLGLLAMGVVLIYRSTRVLNFAVGNMGLPSSTLLALVVINYGFPFWPALILSIVLGTAIGAIIELSIIRRLFAAPRVVVLVATIGIAQLLAFIPLRYPDIETQAGARFPVAVSRVFEDVFGLRITGPDLTIVAVVPVVALGLAWFLNRTTFGQTVQASADNPDLARLSGISPKWVSTVVWTIAGFLATLSTILLSGQSGTISGLANLGPTTMVRALAAAVIGGMRSFPAAMAAGLGIGVAQSVIRFNFFKQAGLVDFLLFVAIVIAVFFQGRRDDDESSAYSFVPRTAPVPDRIRHLAIVRWFVPVVVAIALALAVVAPLLVTKPSRQLLYAQIAAWAVCGLSVTVVTGWAGQIALGQMAFAGIGALSAAAFQRAGVPFVLSLFCGALIVAGVAAIVGIGALRIRGLLLAVSTFAFGLAAERYLYRREIFSDGNTASVPFPRGELFGIDLADQRNYYWFSLAILTVVTAVVVRLRKSGVGRTTIAVRDNQDSASSYTVEPTWVKLRAFSVAGFIAGLGGAMIGGLVQTVPLTERFFLNADSLRLIAMVVIGGIGSVFGAILGALWVVGLPAFAPDNNVIPFLASTIGLLFVLMYFPGGLAERLSGIQEMFYNWLLGRLPDEPNKSADAAMPAGLKPPDRQAEDSPTLVAQNIEVVFGGNRAVDSASIEVFDSEIVGLIGTNGAGKSTMMNAIGGYVPSTGKLAFMGRDISSMAPATRAKLGLGRTFQAATLFPELTVTETVMVALESRGRTGLLSTALFLPHAVGMERRRRSDAADLIDFLGLGGYANHFVSDLSTGTRRIVELAGLLALDARLLCLDEPTAGLAQRETEAFGPLLLEIRKALRASVLIIEHDMPLIMSISDRVYCLETGRVIASGVPSQVRNDPNVVASYLGTDQRAIERSDAGTLPR